MSWILKGFALCQRVVESSTRTERADESLEFFRTRVVWDCSYFVMRKDFCRYAKSIGFLLSLLVHQKVPLSDLTQREI